MVRQVTKIVPYSIRFPGPTPKIDIEEGLPPGALQIGLTDDSRKSTFHWSRGLKWYDRLYAHATLNSTRKNVKCKRPFAPKDSLDFILDSAYCPLLGVFFNKTDPYLQKETVFGEDINIALYNKRRDQLFCRPSRKPVKGCKENKSHLTDNLEIASWRLLRNRFVIFPERPVPRGHPITYSMDGVERRENIYNVKLGIAADHSPQTNPGYSRTPSGAFYSI